MKKYDMTRYCAFAEMGVNCSSREIEDKIVQWPFFHERKYAGGRFLARMIGRQDFERCAEFWRSSYPEVHGSTSEWLLDQDEYEDRFVTVDEYENGCRLKKHCMLIMVDLEKDSVAGASIFTKDDKNLSIEYSFGAIHPVYRKGDDSVIMIGAARDAIFIMEDESGAEYFSAFCETWHSITQFICFKRWGWKIAGIFPGQFTRWRKDNLEYRGCTVHFYKLVKRGLESATEASEWKLLPEVRKLWEALEEINNEACCEPSQENDS